jgi:glycosyltransferase involved in cell wall biosynthesis
MFSILIPVQNYDVSSLVDALHSDSEASGITIEIIVSEDGSEPSFVAKNAGLKNAGFIKHIVFTQERGRSANRNGLAQEAQFNHLIFIDADSGISPGFLRKYADSIDKADAIVGGTAYTIAQKSPGTLLRWKYGTEREMIHAQARNMAPYDSLTANNLCIGKEVFLKTGFDESITQYGHEDTLFGIALKKAGYSILHIDNPVIHLGLESNGRFVEKTFTGVQTLAKLYATGKVSRHDVRLLRFYFKLRSTGLVFLLELAGDFISTSAKKNLLSEKPKLTSLDIYKLVVLHKELKRVI